MSPVLDTFEHLTGRFEIRPTFFGPRVFVEVVANTWDTNTGKDVSTTTYFRKLRSREVSEIGPVTASATELLKVLKNLLHIYKLQNCIVEGTIPFHDPVPECEDAIAKAEGR